MKRLSPLPTRRLCVAASLAVAFCSWALPASAQLAGRLDAGFTLYQTIGDRVISVSPQPDGKIVLGGTYSQIDGTARGSVARVNADGSLDSAFVPPLIESYNTRTDSTITQTNPVYVPAVFTTLVQPDGKILVGGSFYFVNGVSGYGGLIRLNADGSLDSSFNAPRFSGTVFSVVGLSNGEYLVGGDFAYADSTHRNCLVQLKANGKLDNSFNAGTFAGTLQSNVAVSSFPTVTSITVLSGGNILIGGIFTSIDGASRRGIATLHKDGTLDNKFVADGNFNPPSASGAADGAIDQILALAVQSDGKIVVGGTFTDPQTGKPIDSVLRLNADGSLDASFNPGGTGTGGQVESASPSAPTVYAILIDSDGTILIGGGFRTYNGATANAIARLNADGTLDASFSDGRGPGDNVLSLALQTDGKLLAGGIFTDVDGVARPLAARFDLVADTPPEVVVSIAATTRRAHEAGLLKGVLTVTRAGGNPFADLLVRYTTGGTAQPGVDYKPLAGSVTIPGGSSTATIKVRPLVDAPAAGKQAVVVTLTATAAYAPGGSGSAKVKIIDN